MPNIGPVPGQPYPVHNPADTVACVELNLPIQQCCSMCLTTTLMMRHTVDVPSAALNSGVALARNALCDAVRVAAVCCLTVAVIEEERS